MRIAGLTAEMAVVKLHCKESPTIAEHQDVQTAIPNLAASIAQVSSSKRSPSNRAITAMRTIVVLH